MERICKRIYQRPVQRSHHDKLEKNTTHKPQILARALQEPQHMLTSHQGCSRQAQSIQNQPLRQNKAKAVQPSLPHTRRSGMWSWLLAPTRHKTQTQDNTAQCNTMPSTRCGRTYGWSLRTGAQKVKRCYDAGLDARADWAC